VFVYCFVASFPIGVLLVGQSIKRSCLSNNRLNSSDSQPLGVDPQVSPYLFLWPNEREDASMDKNTKQNNQRCQRLPPELR